MLAGSASDDAGNNSALTQSGVEVSVDNTAPTVVFGTNGGVGTGDPSTTVTVEDPTVNSVTSGLASTLEYVWSTDGVTVPTSGWTPFTSGAVISTNTGVADDTYYLWINSISDNVGNTKIATPSSAFIKNSSAVGLIIEPPTGVTHVKENDVINYTATYSNVDEASIAALIGGKISVTGGTLGTIDITDNIVTIPVTAGSTNGPITVDILTGSANHVLGVGFGTAPAASNNSVTVDNTLPTITSPTNNAKTNTSVTPVYSDTSLDYATLQKDGGAVDAYTQGTPITEDGVYILTVYDKAGNSRQITFEINSVPVTGTVGYSIETPTNQDVVATVTFNKPNVTITNNSGNNTYTFTSNGTFTFNFTDEYGNTGTAVATVNNINKTVPTFTITPDVTLTKDGPVVFTVEYTDADSIVLDDTDVSIVSANGITGDITVTNGLTADERIVTISNITGDGKFKIEIGNGTATNLAGNSAASKQSIEISVDNTEPTVTFTPNNAAGTGDPSTTVTVQDPTVNGVSSGLTGTLEYVWSTDGVTVPASGWTPFTSGLPIPHTGAVDDTYYLWVNSISDNVGNTKTATVSGAFIKNSSAINLTIDPPAGVTYVKENDVINYTLTYSNVDESSIAGLIAGKISVTGGTLGTIDITDNIVTIPVTVGSGNGAVVVSVAAGSANHTLGSGFGTAPAVSNNTVIADNASPVISSPTNGAILNTSVTPVYSDTSLDSATLQKDGGTVDVYTQGTPITEDGEYILTVYDELGHSTQVTFTIDKTAPDLNSFEINNGASSTNTETVTLNIDVDDATEMRFSNDNITFSSWEAYDIEKTWTLSSGDGAKTVYAEFRDAAGNVTTATDTITLASSAITVTGITITNPAAKQVYDYGDTIDLTGLEIEVTYSDSNTATKTVADGITIQSGNIADTGVGASIHTVTVVYEGQTVTYTVTVNNKVNSIVITGPSTVSYEYGDALDTTGITITKVWAYGTPEDIALTDAGVSITVPGNKNSLVITDNKVTVSYGGTTEEFTIVVTDPIKSINVVDNKSGDYKYNEPLDITVTGTRSSGATVDLTGQFTTDYNKQLIGNGQVVTVTYGTLTDTITVNVRNYVTGIELTKPTENKYKVGDTLDLTGGSIREVMADGTKGSPISLTLGMISSISYDMNTVGGYSVKVTYTDTDGVDFVKYFPILVTNPASDMNIEIVPEINYIYGDSLNRLVGTVKVTKYDSTTEIIPLADPRITITGYNPRPTGFSATVTQVSQQLTITYTDTFTRVVDGETLTDTVTKSVNHSIIISDIYKGIEIVKPNKLEYVKGEELNLAGGIVKEVMASGVVRNTEPLTSSNTTGYNKNVLGTQTLTVTHLGETKQFTVKVINPVIAISINTLPNKTSYKTGEAINVTGGTIKVIKQNGEEEIIDITNSMISGYNKDKAGTQTVIVTYEGKTVQFIVDVTKKTSTGTGTGTNTSTNNGAGTNTGTNPTDEVPVEEVPDITEETPIEEPKENKPVEDKQDENKKAEVVGTTDKSNGSILPAVAGTLAGFGLLILLLLTLSRKNVEIYNKQETGYVLIGKEKISKLRPNVVLDTYKDDTMSDNFEVILKKSISKKLDKKNITITLGGNDVNYKVNYKNKDYEILVNRIK